MVAAAIPFVAWHQIMFQIWLWWNRWDTARLFERRDPDFGGPPFLLLLALGVVAPLGTFVGWEAGYRWEDAQAVAAAVSASRSSVGYALGSWLLFAPLSALLLAILPRFQLPSERHGQDIDLWTFAMFAAAIAVVSLPPMIWLSVAYPEPFRGMFFPKSGAGSLKQLAVVAVAIGPPLVAAAIVGLFTATVGHRLGEVLRSWSVAPELPRRARPPHEIGVLSCVAGASSVLVSLFLDPRHLSVPGVLTILLLWLVAGLASVNAMARGGERSWADRLAYGGLALMMASLVIHAR
jgi:hypothetical protein